MLKEKVIVVTGGAGLLGSEFVRTIIENNGIAILADINIDENEKLKNYFIDSPNSNNIELVEFDITSKRSIWESISLLKNKYGKIDSLINNAFPRNKNFNRHFFDVELIDFCDNVEKHLGGYFLTSQQFSLFFKEQNYGNIINIASIYGVIAPRFEIYKGTNMTSAIEYSVIKSGIIHMTKYMAKYLKGYNIRVNSISPGGIFDNQPESFIQNYNKFCISKGMLNSRDLCGALLFLLSDMSQYVNGQNIIVDDGFTL